MSASALPSVDDATLLAAVEAQVRAWLDAAASKPVHPSAARLAAVLDDPRGLEFTVGFVDRVIRPEDHRVAAKALRELVGITPRFLPWHLKLALRAGAELSRVAPGLVVPLARAALRRMVGHLLIDATDAKLGAAISRIRARGARLNINLLGEAVLGRAEADRRLRGTRELLSRDDVDYVSIKVSSPVAPHSPWAYDAAVDHVVARLLPLYQLAAARSASGDPKFINLDMEEYHDLDITIDVFMRLLDREELLGLEAGIVLQAYLPDSLAAMVRLQEWSARRRARGGAPIKVRLVKGANLPMERVQASLFGWPLATWGSKQQTDTHYKRVLAYALTAEHVRNVRLGVAGHNLFDVAHAWEVAGRAGVRDGIEVEMLLGMAEGQAEAVRETVGDLLLYVPVVHPDDFDAAIAYLVRRLEEGASPENFMSAVVDLHDDAALYRRERDRFVTSLAAVDDQVPAPRRTQDRRAPVTAQPATSFANTQDTDPSLAGNREWARQLSARIPTSALGRDLVGRHTLTDAAAVEELLAAARRAGGEWGRRPSGQRAAVLRAAAVELERRRADLIEVAASETGKTIDQGDPEVSEAIDFLNHYAELAEGLDAVDGAQHVPVGLTLVVPPWNFPLAIPVGGIAAALAAGSAVVVKPAPQARRCGSVLVEALWDAGVPREVLRLVHVAEDEVGEALLASPLVDRTILTGAFETAQLLRRVRPDTALLAETSGKNAIVITPDADLDLAVKDLVTSAFGHAGQKCSAASLAILVGSVATSARFRDQLVDAVTSLQVAEPTDPTAQVGPVIEPASGKLLRALTHLAPGEAWLVPPRRLDEEGRLWSPGVKTGVARGSEFHLTECFGPVLGLVAAADLDEAIAIQNETDYGLTAGLHSLDRQELEVWVDAVEAGNLYVNRTTVGAIVRRQPFGGWKKSAVGPGTKAGGPHYLVALSDWAPAPARVLAPVLARVAPVVDAACRLGLSDLVARGAGSDAVAWREEFGVARDVSGLMAERNVLRYLPVPVTIRVEEGDDDAALLRVLAAGLAARAHVTVSAATALDPDVAALITAVGADRLDQDERAWAALLAGDAPPARVRLLGPGGRAAFVAASGGRPDIALYSQPVVEAGRIEMLTFLHEQAVAVTAHRFGSPTPLAEGLVKGPLDRAEPASRT